MVEAGLEAEAAELAEEHLQAVIGLVTAEQHCLPTGKVRPPAGFGLIGTGWIQEATCFLPVCNIGGEDTATKMIIDSLIFKNEIGFQKSKKKVPYMMYLKPTNCSKCCSSGGIHLEPS